MSIPSEGLCYFFSVNRQPPPLRPDWRTGRLATALLGLTVAGLVGAFAWSGWGTPVQPVAVMRAFIPPLLAPMLALAMAGFTLWSAFEASSDLYGTTELGGWLEVLLMGVTVVGLVGYLYLWVSQQEGRRVAGRAHEAATRSPGF